MSNSDLLPTRAAAQMLQLDVKQIVRLTQRGDLPHALRLEGPRGAYLFKKTEILKYGEQLAAAAENRARAIRAALAEQVS